MRFANRKVKSYQEVIKMKKITALMLCVILVFSFAACGKGEANEKLTEITVCLDWTPNTNHTGFFVADSLGYYEQEGIRVSIVQPPENGAELMVASGQAQFGVSFQDGLAATFASEEPLEITAVGAILQHNTSGIVSRKGEGTDRPKGLENKKYSTWDSPIELKIIESVMKSDGGDYSLLQPIPNVITNEAEALKNKDTDAVWIYYAWSGVQCELSGLEFDYFNFVDIDPVFDYYTPVIVSNNSFLSENPEIAKAFMSATKKGYEYAVENPEQAAKILIEGDTTGSLAGSEELVTESQKWIADKYIADAESWGVIDTERWDNFYNWLYEQKLIDKKIDSGFGFTNDYLN